MGACCCSLPQSWSQLTTPLEATNASAQRLVNSVVRQLSGSEDAHAMWAAAGQKSAESVATQIIQAVADPSMPPAVWRLLAIHFQQNIFVIDSHFWTISCYSCQAGPVAVRGKTEPEKPQTKCLLKHWTQPGFHYGIGCLPLPESMKMRSARVYPISSAGRLLSTSACQFARSSKVAEASKELSHLPFATFAMPGVQ